jgi:hypothetical protein
MTSEKKNNLEIGQKEKGIPSNLFLHLSTGELVAS